MVWRIKRERAELALMNARKTWKQIAEDTHTSPGTIVKALQGKGKTSLKTIGKLADALGVQVEEIAESVPDEA